VERSWLGYGFTAIRDDETAAEATGVPTLRLKLVATGLSGALMGMAGAPLPYYVSFLEPASTFNLAYAVNTIAMAMIGGNMARSADRRRAAGDRAAGRDRHDLVRDQSDGRRRLAGRFRHAGAERDCRAVAPPTALIKRTRVAPHWASLPVGRLRGYLFFMTSAGNPHRIHMRRSACSK
jgi:hypothetical protein